MNDNETIISIYGSHNASVSVARAGRILEVIELERFVNHKNAALINYLPLQNANIIIEEIQEYISQKHNIVYFDICLYQETKGIEKLINAGVKIPCLHHRSHAAGSFYQSSYDEATIISFDGGGNDGFFNVYSATRIGSVKLESSYMIDLGVPYGLLGHYMLPIRREKDIYIGNLVYAGKIMGLSAYGIVQDDWKPLIREFYLDLQRLNNYNERVITLLDNLGLEYNEDYFLSEQTSSNLAATSQRVFCDLFFETIGESVLESCNLILTGGCALNILLVEEIKERNSTVFVAPNSSDCGLSAGMILDYMKPSTPMDLTYIGSPIYDKTHFVQFIPHLRSKPLEYMRLARYLSKGVVIGVIRNGSEHGPRALGNRSILCSPTFPDMKDKLNKQVKNREYYRPFAPVCIEEFSSDFFENSSSSRWMTTAVRLKSEFKFKLKAISHIDGTCRLQTVKYEENPFLYSLLSHVNHVTGFPILINTSFNIAGKPMINRVTDALEMLNTGQIDALIIQDTLYFSSNQNASIY